jgi:hypothetical protein
MKIKDCQNRLTRYEILCLVILFVIIIPYIYIILQNKQVMCPLH